MYIQFTKSKITNKYSFIIKGRNGWILAKSVKEYSSRSNCLRAIKQISDAKSWKIKERREH